VEIINPGKLLFPIEELGKRSAQRNPILVDLVHRLGLIEKAGSGIKRMKKMMDEEGLEMEFEVGTYFSTIFHRHKSDADAKQMQSKCKADAKQSKEDRIAWIMNELKKGDKIKADDVEYRFSIHRVTAIRDLNKLIKQNRIVKKGAGNNVWYELKDGEDEA